MFLTLLTFLPAIGIPFLFMTKDVKTQRMIGLATSAAAMLLSLYLFFTFDAAQTDPPTEPLP